MCGGRGGGGGAQGAAGAARGGPAGHRVRQRGTAPPRVCPSARAPTHARTRTHALTHRHARTRAQARARMRDARTHLHALARAWHPHTQFRARARRRTCTHASTPPSPLPTFLPTHPHRRCFSLREFVSSRPALRPPPSSPLHHTLTPCLSRRQRVEGVAAALAAGVRLGALTHVDLRGIALSAKAPLPRPRHILCAPTIDPRAPRTCGRIHTHTPQAHLRANPYAHADWGAAQGNGRVGRLGGVRGGSNCSSATYRCGGGA